MAPSGVEVGLVLVEPVAVHGALAPPVEQAGVRVGGHLLGQHLVDGGLPRLGDPHVDDHHPRDVDQQVHDGAERLGRHRPVVAQVQHDATDPAGPDRRAAARWSMAVLVLPGDVGVDEDVRSQGIQQLRRRAEHHRVADGDHRDRGQDHGGRRLDRRQGSDAARTHVDALTVTVASVTARIGGRSSSGRPAPLHRPGCSPRCRWSTAGRCTMAPVRSTSEVRRRAPRPRRPAAGLPCPLVALAVPANRPSTDRWPRCGSGARSAGRTGRPARA